MNKELIEQLLSKNITFIAVTKYVSANKIKDLYNLGVKNIGESKAFEFLDKYEELKHLDLTFHFIGHLQRNKAKKIINKIDCLHSLDSLELAKIIQKEREKPLDCFIELKLTDNENKHGVKLADLDSFINSIKNYDKLNVLGFMTMCDDDMEDDKKEEIFSLADNLKEKYNYKYLSMGMSDDYLLALKHHSTHIRIGRSLYTKDEALDNYKHYFD